MEVFFWERRRWQSKEYDGDHNKYYFGARYFDPFFGLWTSPDPAGQYADPYTYGGDPLNYADPTGMWSVGVGLVFGWDKSHGWNVGVGIAADIGNGKGGNFNASYAWNQDGSGSFSLGAGGTVRLAWLPIAMNFGGSYSYNSYTGHTLSTQTGACFGYEGLVCAGNEFGGSLYWDNGGNFQGATVFAENYIEAAGGSARFSNGYEQGLFGMEGRGVYAGGDIGGLHAEVSQNGGWNYGWSMMVANAGYNSEKGFAYNYIGRDIVNSAFDENCADVPPVGENLVPENPLNFIWHIFNGDGGLGTNYVGQTSEDKLGRMPITGALDLAAFLHDIGYLDAGASGPTSAFFNTSSKVLSADFRLSGRSFVAAFVDRTGGKSHMGEL